MAVFLYDFQEDSLHMGVYGGSTASLKKKKRRKAKKQALEFLQRVQQLCVKLEDQAHTFTGT